MPSYEAALLLRKMGNPETAVVLKRAILKIFDNNGILFGIENLGTRNLPILMRKHGMKHREGRYVIVKFDAPAMSLSELYSEYHRDLDIIRTGFHRIKPDPVVECTLQEELKPPAYREDVEKMIATGRKEERKFEAHDGLNYYPWRT